MGVSIYYQARRHRPLSAQEQTAINEIDRLHAVVGAEFEQGSFGIYPPNEHTEPGVIFEGATGLPLTTEDEFWEAIQHWCRALTLIRRVLSDATWTVHVDDHAIVWNDEQKAYDPSSDATDESASE